MMKVCMALLLALAAISCSPGVYAGFLQSGTEYYIEHKGGRSNCGTQVDFLAFLNKTCSAGTVGKTYGPTVGPVLRSSTIQWRQWTVTVVGNTTEGDDLVTLDTFYPANEGKPLCLGYMVVENQLACTTEYLADRVHIHPTQQDVWRFSPVEGDDSFNIIAESRAAGCLSYLGGAAACADTYVQLYAGDDGSGQQRWVLSLAPSPPPQPPLPGYPPSVTVSALDCATVEVDITPPQSGCTPASYVLRHMATQSDGPPFVTALPQGWLTAQLGDLVGSTQYTLTVVGVCPDGSTTPPSSAVQYTTADMQVTTVTVSGVTPDANVKCVASNDASVYSAWYSWAGLYNSAPSDGGDVYHQTVVRSGSADDSGSASVDLPLQAYDSLGAAVSTTFRVACVIDSPSEFDLSLCNIFPDVMTLTL